MENKAMPTTLTSLVDFGAVGDLIAPLMTAAATAAVVIGATILAARVGWKLFRSFAK